MFAGLGEYRKAFVVPVVTGVVMLLNWIAATWAGFSMDGGTVTAVVLAISTVLVYGIPNKPKETEDVSGPEDT